MTIGALINAIEARLNTSRHPDIKDVGITAGRFGATELMEESFRAPALRIAFLGATRSKAAANEQRLYDAGFAVFIITDAKNRATLGVELAEWVASRMTLFISGVKDCGTPKDMRIEALYTAEVDRKGVSLHAVGWAQTIRMGVDAIDAGVFAPEAFLSGAADGPEITVTDIPEGI